MSANVFSLPVPLILLVHLHILQYPHTNKPEYDHSIFDPRVRGLRDRTKTMEDVCYFLVARIEGTKELVRKVLPTYPCPQPADTTAFRTSLAKFLENLRHQSIFTNDSGKQSRPGGKAMSPVVGAAWWWKDVVVRKSLLEECAGERFERLLLALSTHALFKGSATLVEPNETHALLRGQPRIYMKRLATFQSHQNSWAQAACRLIQQQSDLKVLRANVFGFKSTKYASLSTEKLRALADSKLQELLAIQWSGPGGHSALKFLAELSGLTELESLSTTAPSQSVHEATSGAEVRTEIPTTPPPPLPIAAAHHPAALRKLSKRIFPKANAHAPSEAPDHALRPHAALALSGSVYAEARMLQALTDAVARMRKAVPALTARLNAKQKPAANHQLRALDLNLWQDSGHICIDFEVSARARLPLLDVELMLPQGTLTDAYFIALGLTPPDSEASIESRVGAIRQTLVPKYPSIHAPTAAQPTATRLPQPSRPRARSPPQTPKPARRLEPSTPPATVKPRRQSERDSKPERLGTATLRAAPKHSLTTSPPATFSLLTDPLDAGYLHDEDDDEEDAFGAFGEGPSMSVRDLLLQADTTHFDIIGGDDDSSGFDDQSFGWA
ncbi:hypothetical protein FB451DRAFT_1555437 [Mycena latifolia]|nr:hypothetical protein FB451DRAFT_1555437 [Mycena latifolia]